MNYPTFQFSKKVRKIAKVKMLNDQGNVLPHFISSKIKNELIETL